MGSLVDRWSFGYLLFWRRLH